MSWRSIHISMLGLVMLILVTGCQMQAGSVANVALGAEVPPSSTPAPSATLASPVLSVAQPPTPLAVEMPSFALPTIAPTAVPKQEPAVEAKAAVTETPAATETPSPTPQPTYTPPALPGTSPNEHYWLRRPIPEGGTVWTDKSYPYGGTRGGTLRPHHGVEFYVPTGTAVQAAASGTVVAAGTDAETVYGPHTNFYGNLIIISSDSTYGGLPVYTVYGHLSQIFVNEGQHVEAEEIIALSGATGVADGPHLHFEVRVGQNSEDDTRNPLLWLYPFPDHGTIAGRVIWPNGELAHGVQLFARRVDASSKYAETTSYANEVGELNGDDGWQENFAFDDILAGYYEVEARRGQEKYKSELWVYPYQTSFVELILE
jgi:murein DD-endopeptidase MepM/ murein hydrolase activator NlpD